MGGDRVRRGGVGKEALDALGYLLDWFDQDDTLKDSWQHQGYSALGADPRRDGWQGGLEETITTLTLTLTLTRTLTQGDDPNGCRGGEGLRRRWVGSE